MGRQLAVTKRTSLAGLNDWGDECYVEWRPITYGESIALSKSDVSEGDDDAVALEMMIKYVKEHVVRGKVKVINDHGEDEVADLETDDIDQMPTDMINRIFADMTGVDMTDPKVESSIQAPSDTEQQSPSENTTDT